MHVREPSIQAVVVIVQFFVIEAQDLQHGGIEIPDGHRIDLRAATKLIGGTLTDTAFDTGAHHPRRKPVGVVISSGRALLMSWHSPEFRCPQHKRVLK